MSEAAPRSVAGSRATLTRLTVPSDANIRGSVFGGVILEEVDRSAYISASRHCRRNCVTASIDRVDFLAPVHVGEALTFDSELTYAGRTSMEISVHVRAENPLTGDTRSVASALVTMVAVDEGGRPLPIPPLAPATEEERARFEAGRQRMEERRRTRGSAAAARGAN
ncbi:MAG TPA: acyl-CoA thioesterase [Thermoplasmata archaeon]|nr:acyl-CoA thioesterase [Thermoplasmata archaeon]